MPNLCRRGAAACAVLALSAAAHAAQPIDYPSQPAPSQAFFQSNPGLVLNVSASLGYSGSLFAPFELNDATINVLTGGVLGQDNTSWSGGTINIESGGSTAQNSRFTRAEVNVNGGTIAPGTTVDLDATVTVNSGVVNPQAAQQREVFLRDNGRLIVNGGEVVGPINVDDNGRLEIRGGSVRDPRLSAGNPDADPFSEITFSDQSTGAFSGGAIDDSVLVTGDASVQIDGGTFGNRVIMTQNARATITGGAFPNFFSVNDQSEITISGGVFEDSALGSRGIAPGEFGNYFRLDDQATLNLVGLEFRLDGELLDLAAGESMALPDRDGAILEATLADGNDFIVSLDEFGAPSASVEEDRFEPGTTVNVRVVPAPGSAAAALGAFLLAGRRRRDARA